MVLKSSLKMFIGIEWTKNSKTLIVKVIAGEVHREFMRRVNSFKSQWIRLTRPFPIIGMTPENFSVKCPNKSLINVKHLSIQIFLIKHS